MLLTAPTTVTEGDSINYSFVVANAGPNDASGVTASIQLAPGMYCGLADCVPVAHARAASVRSRYLRCRQSSRR